VANFGILTVPVFDNVTSSAKHAVKETGCQWMLKTLENKKRTRIKSSNLNIVNLSLIKYFDVKQHK
jgi:hypothetical protein